MVETEELGRLRADGAQAEMLVSQVLTETRLA